jgi:hypothetical protein
MPERIAAVLDQIEAQQQTQALPENVSALTLLQMVYRGALKVSAQQMRAAIETLPYENPKLSAMAITSLSGNDFARALDRCIERSSKAKLIEARAEPTD